MFVQPIKPGPEVVNMYKMFGGRKDIAGFPVCGDNVEYMGYTYFCCSNLTGNPVCGPNVKDMSHTYSGCLNITGSPVCGENVENMISAYEECISLTGICILGHNVKYLYGTFYGCNALSGVDIRKCKYIPFVDDETFPKGIKIYMTKEQYDKAMKYSDWEDIKYYTHIIIKELDEEI